MIPVGLNMVVMGPHLVIGTIGGEDEAEETTVGDLMTGEEGGAGAGLGPDLRIEDAHLPEDEDALHPLLVRGELPGQVTELIPP